jgi:hypothetical protein
MAGCLVRRLRLFADPRTRPLQAIRRTAVKSPELPAGRIFLRFAKNPLPWVRESLKKYKIFDFPF